MQQLVEFYFLICIGSLMLDSAGSMKDLSSFNSQDRLVRVLIITIAVHHLFRNGIRVQPRPVSDTSTAVSRDGKENH
jgi:hypothetical protein